MSYAPSWLRDSSPDLAAVLAGLGDDASVGAKRFAVRNFLLEEGVPRQRAEGYARLAAQRVSTADAEAAFEQFYVHHNLYLSDRQRGGVRTEQFTADAATCPETFTAGEGADDGADGVDDVTWLGRVDEIANIALHTGESRHTVRTALDLMADRRRNGITDIDAADDITHLLYWWQQRLDNRPLSAFVWSDLENMLSDLHTGWENELRDSLGLEHLDPTMRDPGAGIDVVVFRYPVRLVPTGSQQRPVLRRPTPFDVDLREAFCTSPPVGAGHCVDLQFGADLCREVLHPAVVFKAEHVWAVGTIRAGVDGPVDELRGFHLLKLVNLDDADFQHRFERVDRDLV
ncbi:hypothetical protein ACFPIJ_31520 [Dactylosporangium cerinum]|uniref:Uncharacterized protein n=1 Tax=Dactylosporangium cerinum TaxID=1434730 RepID=A0ABV9W434_9ACTN